jgi:CubicO group peptidase (beta-lactamase class C family)
LSEDDELRSIAAALVDDHGVAPCAVLGASFRRAAGWHRAGAVHGTLAPGGALASLDTVFDLASVTKPFTALAAARLERSGRLDRSAPLGSLVDEARGTPSEDVPLDLFLAHRAGLDGHRTLWTPLVTGERFDRSAALEVAARARRGECIGPPPVEGFAPVYSDLGYLLAGEAVARAAGTSLSSVITAEIIAPLGLSAGSAAAMRESAPPRSTAPTEIAAFRGGVVIAAVHDENAWAFSGLDVAGHAGLFGTASDLVSLGEALIEALAGERPGWLTRDELRPLIRERPGGTLRAGFDGKSAEGSSAGTRFGPRSVGHLGFTGTSLWIDPDAGLVCVLLTNRVHPTRATDAIRRGRPLAHDAVAEWASRNR